MGMAHLLKAARHSAYAEAANRFEQALIVLGRLPQTADRLAEAIDLRFDLRSVLLPLGERARILERLREARPARAAVDLIVIFMTQLMPSSAYPLRRELRVLTYAALMD